MTQSAIHIKKITALGFLLVATVSSAGCSRVSIQEGGAAIRVLAHGFVEGSFELAVLDFKSGSKTTLTNRRVISPTSFSFDRIHSRVVFSAPAEDGEELFLISPETEPWQVLTRGGNRFGEPRWAPDGQSIAFNAKSGDGRYRISWMAADGTNMRPLPNEDVAARDPLWSADGSLIAVLLFAAAPRSENDLTGIGIIKVSSGELRSFATDPLDITFSTPAWSPIVGKLVFSALHGESRDLFLLDVQSGEIDSLANTDADEWNGVWSPDGSKLAYLATSSENALQANLVVLDLATSTRNLLLEGEPSISSITWLDESTILLGVYDPAESATVFYTAGLGENRVVDQGRWPGIYLDPVVLP